MLFLVFRKELSSNRDYRKKRNENNKVNWKPMTNMTQKFIEKLNLIDGNTFQLSELNDDDNNNGTSPSPSSISSSSATPAIEKLNIDVLVLILGYLTNVDVCRFSCVDSKMAKLLHTDFIWERLWVQRYEGLWRNPIIKSIARRRNVYWSPFDNWGPPSQGWKLFLLEFEYGIIIIFIIILI